MLVVGLVVCACVPNWDAPNVEGDDAPFVFEIPKGSTGGGLGPRLAEAGLADETWWKVFLKTGADASCVKAGKFQVRKSMSYNELLKTFCGPPMADDVPFTVVEGWRIRDIDAALVEKGWIEPGAYVKMAESKDLTLPFPIESPTLEGYLYPETYMVPAGGIDVKQLAMRQLETFQERFLSKHPDGFSSASQIGGEARPRTLHEVVVVASMLEREEPKPKNRPLVSGIMWKRVDRNFGLGIDATSRYTLPDWNDRDAFLVKLRDPEDPYNTRLRKGLPPTAIGNPAIESLEAAAKPEASEFLYYLHDAQQNLHPARDAAEHDANRIKFGVF